MSAQVKLHAWSARRSLPAAGAGGYVDYARAWSARKVFNRPAAGGGNHSGGCGKARLVAAARAAAAAEGARRRAAPDTTTSISRLVFEHLSSLIT